MNLQSTFGDASLCLVKVHIFLRNLAKLRRFNGLSVSSGDALFPQVTLPFRKLYADLSKAARFLSLFLSPSLSSLSSP